jgi:hypothetical protein
MESFFLFFNDFSPFCGKREGMARCGGWGEMEE